MLWQEVLPLHGLGLQHFNLLFDGIVSISEVLILQHASARGPAAGLHQATVRQGSRNHRHHSAHGLQAWAVVLCEMCYLPAS